MHAAAAFFRRLGDRWLDHRLGPPAPATRLSYRRIFLLPSRGGLLFAAMVVAIWLAGVNYVNSMAFLLCFLLIGIGGVTMLHAFRNLLGLKLRMSSPEPVFAGQEAHFRLELDDTRGQARYGLECICEDMEPLSADVPANGRVTVHLPVPATRRGHLLLPRLQLRSSFPGGLFTAWSWPRFAARGLVYPSPEQGTVPPPVGAGDGDPGTATGRRGDEDFHGLRRYQAGDSLRQVAWRALARGQELQTKRFSGDDGGALWLDWSGLSGMDTEARLSRLCRWILDAETRHRPYGLRLPGIRIPPDCGPMHRHRCLETLALMPPVPEP